MKPAKKCTTFNKDLLKTAKNTKPGILILAPTTFGI
jgi:hypothetical protein